MHIVASVLCLIAVLCLISDSVVSASEGVDVAVEVEELIDSMVLIPGGTFRMGDGAGSGHSSQRPVHEVAIRSFMLGRQEVTFAQWDACVFDGGCGSYRPDDRGWGRGMRPVVNVAWEDVQAFIVWLNARTGGGYRLPTEAEWEYAARAGTLTEYAWGDAIGHNRANCDGCGSQWDDEQTAPVGRFPANAWGLHDMQGNVFEWLTDCKHASYDGAPGDGSAWTDGGDCTLRGIRGGAWFSEPRFLRAAARGWTAHTNLSAGVGFRLAADVPALARAGPPPDAIQQVAAELARQQRAVKAAVREISMDMVSIPGGVFRMGDLSDTGYRREKPVHEVTVQPFKLGRYEVTFVQWDACVADGGCGGYRPNDRGWGRGNRPMPVMDVSWDDAQAFIVWLNARTDGGYRLPTEAEWEYAARAGTLTEYAWGDATGHNRANCDGCGSQWDDEQTAPVGRFPANAWGLHDMHGNVDEWLTDCWHENYKGAPDDGSAWVHGGDCGWRVMRGGGYSFPPDDLRSAARGWATRLTSGTWLGFRVAQDK